MDDKTVKINIKKIKFVSNFTSSLNGLHDDIEQLDFNDNFNNSVDCLPKNLKILKLQQLGSMAFFDKAMANTVKDEFEVWRKLLKYANDYIDQFDTKTLSINKRMNRMNAITGHLQQ